MTDLEILNLAAKAAIGAGMPLHYGPHALQPEPHWQNAGDEWCPLTDDGDALRLAVTLRMLVDADGESYTVSTATPKGTGVHAYEKHKQDPFAATRRAIVRAAAEMGKTIE